MTIPIARGRRLLLGALIGASVTQAALAAVAAFCVQMVFDGLLAQDGVLGDREIALVAIAFAASALTIAALETYRSWAGERLGLGYVQEMRGELFSKIMRASRSAISSKRQGGLLLPFVGDLTAIKKWVSDGLVRLISAGATTLLLLGVLASQNWRLALAAGVVMALAALAVLQLSGPLNAAIRETRARRGAVANFVSSSFRAAQTVQAFNRFGRELQRLQRRSQALMKAGLRLAMVSGLMTSIVHLASAMLVASILVVGVFEVRSGAMSIGLVAAAISIAGLLSGAVRDLGIAFELWRRAKVSFAKVAAALAIEASVEDMDGGRRIARGATSVSFEAVSVKGVFRGVSVEAGPGAIVNVVGDSGAGKSMLLALVARMRDPDGGRVRINGRNLRRAALASVRRHVGVASASMPLLRGTIAMNLRYRSPGATEAEIARVSEICNLGPIIEKTPEGALARLGEDAQELSRGEIQRLLIARAMVDSPPILILDDVDSHLDAETAARVASALRDYEGVVLMAATAPAWRRAANLVWRIADGRVRAECEPSSPVEIVQVKLEGGDLQRVDAP
ncbi:MAG: ABC transporter ATP-binding protein [Terricaulis sp.]